MSCEHADLMMIYAKQAAEMDEPWKLWEWRTHCGGWNRFDEHFAFYDCYEYRQIPKTININGHEVPEPMREKPEIDSKYWYIHSAGDVVVDSYSWVNDQVDNMLFSRGLCHLTREAAIAHAKALLSFSEVVL